MLALMSCLHPCIYISIRESNSLAYYLLTYLLTYNFSMPSAMLDINSTLRLDDLFSVDGLVAVITGGGTGSHSFLAT